MITATFDVAMHEEYGMIGLRMSNRPHFDPLQGMAIAHDMLEHPKNDDGTFEHELMALGASIFVRDHESYYAQRGQRNVDPAKNIASDMVEQFHLNGGGYVLRKPANGARPLDDDWAEGIIQRVWMESRNLLPGEVDQMPAWLEEDQKANYIGWLRSGYRYAIRRYAKMCASEMCYIFQQVETAADDILRDAVQGQQYRFSIDLNRHTVSVREIGAARWEY